MATPATPGQAPPLLGYGTPPGYQQLEPLNNHSIAYEASRVVKTGPGLLFGFQVYNSDTGGGFVQLFDAATLPADGAIPEAVFAIATVANLPVAYLPARTFRTGIVIVYSSTGPTKTIGGAKLYIDAQYL